MIARTNNDHKFELILKLHTFEQENELTSDEFEFLVSKTVHSVGWLLMHDSEQTEINLELLLKELKYKE